MPGVGTKQQKTSALAQTIAATDDPQLTPDAVLNDFGQFCIALPATGALIAVRDLSGLRCTVSFGQAPAVGSKVPTDSALITQCFATSEFAISEELLEATTTDQENAASVPGSAGSDTQNAVGVPTTVVSDLWNLPDLHERVTSELVAESDASVGASAATGGTDVAASASIPSAIVMPIRVQGSVVGLIEVFSSQPSEFSPIGIAELLLVAKSFATLMVHDAANGGQPIIGGSLDEPIILPQLAADQQSQEHQAPANPAPVATDKPASVEAIKAPSSVATLESPPTVPTIENPATRKISKPATAIPVAVSVNKTLVIPKAVTLSQLPSDRPTPKRVWLIAVGLLLALSLLALLLFKVNY